jgi:hypothetical protein
MEDPYHGLPVADVTYAGEWREMFGRAE